MPRLLFCLIALSFLPSSVFSQDIGVSIGAGVVQANGQPPRDSRLATGHAAIRGRVLASDGGQPMRRATVRVNAPELRVARTAVTDADGRYDFRDLPPGRYSINASKPAFVNWSYGQTLPNGSGKPIVLSDNQTADNVDIRLFRGGVITGRVIDEFGDPVPNAAVTPLRRVYQQGQNRLSPAGDRAQANDIGEYRIFGLAPGQYYLSSTVQALTLAMPIGNSVEVSGQSSGYAATFYPGTADAASAQKVTVGVAQTLSGVDIALTPTRLATITGIAIDSEGRPMTAGGVYATARSGGWAAGGVGGPLRPDGTFTIANVPPGEYVLRANAVRTPGALGNAPPEFSVAVVNVTGDDISGVRLAPVALVAVSGHVSFDDPGAAQSLNPSAVRVVAQAINADDFAGIGVGAGGPPRPVKDDFTFELKTAPGRIGLISIVQQSGPANTWRLKSIRVNGTDATDSGIEVGSQAISGIEIEMTNRLQQITGTVTDARGDAVKDYTVAMFSQDRARWKAPMNRYFALGRPGPDDGFKIATLPPGDYYAVAVDRIESSEWEDPETLEGLSRVATAFTLTPGDARTLTLRLFTSP
jgi:protocatechuate 3,4-dioxygenase beta subunit